MRRSPTDVASTRLWWKASSPWEQHRRGSTSKFFKKSSTKDFQVPATPVHTAGKGGGDENEEEQARRAASRQMGQPAPGGRNQRFPAGSVFDPARYQNANGESGGGDFNSPRSGPYNRDGSRSPKDI